MEGDDVARYADDGGVGRDVGDDDGTRANARVFADFDAADDLRSGADRDLVAKRGMALDALGTGAAEGDALVEHDVVADFGSFTDDHAHTVIDEEAAADDGAGMDFDAGEKAREVHEAAGKK